MRQVFNCAIVRNRQRFNWVDQHEEIDKAGQFLTVVLADLPRGGYIDEGVREAARRTIILL
jgi:hypothetical protein